MCDLNLEFSSLSLSCHSSYNSISMTWKCRPMSILSATGKAPRDFCLILYSSSAFGISHRGWDKGEEAKEDTDWGIIPAHLPPRGWSWAQGHNTGSFFSRGRKYHFLPHPRDPIPLITSSAGPFRCHYTLCWEVFVGMKAAPRCLLGVCPQCAVPTLISSGWLHAPQTQQMMGASFCHDLYPSRIREPCILPAPRL